MHYFLSALFTFGVWSMTMATDTTFYDNGAIQSIRKDGRTYMHYYQNGHIKEKAVQHRLGQRGKQVLYDSLGQVIVKGKTQFYGVKHGKWKHYQNGERTETIKYKFGIRKSALKTDDGKRIRCYLTYGLGGWGGPCEGAKDSIRVRFVPVAGCTVTRQTLVKTSIHNFFVSLILNMQLGKAWQEAIDEICGA